MPLPDPHWHDGSGRHEIGKIKLHTSVVDPVGDPYDFGPLGSVSQRYGSGSFYRQAKIVRKPLIPIVLLLLYDFLSSNNELNVPSKSN